MLGLVVLGRSVVVVVNVMRGLRVVVVVEGIVRPIAPKPNLFGLYPGSSLYLFLGVEGGIELLLAVLSPFVAGSSVTERIY